MRDPYAPRYPRLQHLRQRVAHWVRHRRDPERCHGTVSCLYLSAQERWVRILNSPALDPSTFLGAVRPSDTPFLYDDGPHEITEEMWRRIAALRFGEPPEGN